MNAIVQNKRLPHIFPRHLVASLLVIIAITIAGYVWSEKQIYHANNLRYQFFLLADELRQSSDDLTRMARTYVMTGDPLYKKNYQAILDIRDGKKPRPERYQNIYWDLEPNEQTSRHGGGQAIAMLELMRQAGFSEDEFRKLAQAKANSDALTSTELKAMQLVETSGPEAEANRDMARIMMHDDKYLKAKAAIMKPIDELMEKRTLDAVQAAIDKAMILRGVFVVFGLGLMLLLWRINKVLHVFLGGSVDEIYAQIVKIGCGDFSSAILVADDRENSVLGWLAKTQVNLNKIDDERKQLEDEREEALNRLQKIASQVPGVVYQYRLRPDGSSCFPFASEAIRVIFRLSPEEVREDASKIFAILHPDDYDGMVTSIQKSVQDLIPWHHEYRVKFDDGKVCWLLGNALPQREADGSTLWHGFITDITERKLAEEALRQSEQQFRTLAEALPQIVWITRPDGWNIYYNHQWVEFTGLTLEESYGHGWCIPIHPDDRERTWDAWQQATQTDGIYSLECRLRRADGIYRWWLIRGVSLHNENGKVINWFGTCTDIQDIKESEEKLQLAASVFTNAREGIMITATDGTIIEVNDAFCDITGYSRDEVQGRNPRFLNSGRQENEFYAAMWRDLIAQGVWSGEIWNRRKNGEIYAEMLTISAVRDAQSKPRHYVALFTDITPFKEHERRLEHSAHFDTLTGLPNRVLLADRL